MTGCFRREKGGRKNLSGWAFVLCKTCAHLSSDERPFFEEGRGNMRKRAFFFFLPDFLVIARLSIIFATVL